MRQSKMKYVPNLLILILFTLQKKTQIEIYYNDIQSLYPTDRNINIFNNFANMDSVWDDHMGNLVRYFSVYDSVFC